MTKDDEGMVVLTQKGENENPTTNTFRVTAGGRGRRGNDNLTARSLPPNFVACDLKIRFVLFSESFLGIGSLVFSGTQNSLVLGAHMML